MVQKRSLVCSSRRSCRAHVLRGILSSPLGSDLRCDSIQDPRPPILVPIKVKSSVKRSPLVRSMNAAAQQGARKHNKSKRDNDGWRRHLALLCGVLMCGRHCEGKSSLFWGVTTRTASRSWYYAALLSPLQHLACMLIATHKSSLQEDSKECVQCLRLI